MGDVVHMVRGEYGIAVSEVEARRWPLLSWAPGEDCHCVVVGYSSTAHRSGVTGLWVREWFPNRLGPMRRIKLTTKEV